MFPIIDSPVQTQMAVSILNHTFSSDLHSNRKNEGKPATGRRRVFVQTETGCVLGIELDRGDNAHTVKRRLQVALNVPTEETSLTFGDLVLKNDLSGIRNDSPLLLTRNFLHRSSSTPCLSPTGKDLQQKDRSALIEVLVCSSRCSRTKKLVKDVVKAIKNGMDPIPVHSGLGGAYYFKNNKGQSIAIVKPTDEEPFAPNNPKGFIGKALGQPGLKRSVRVGETGFREVAAYLLDHGHFANVPPTFLVKITHSIFHINESVSSNGNKANSSKPAISKIASFQQFIPHDYDASDHGTSSFPVAAVHRIGILDVRIFNTDRHAGNLLVKKLEAGSGFGGQVELIPIDHGLCLPENLEDPYFEWIHWPQASIPFSEDELEYIANLDPVRDSDMLRMELPMIREACLRVLILCTIFLKEAASHGLCLAEIGEMMSREFRRMEEEPSELEAACIEARRLVAEKEAFSPVPGLGFGLRDGLGLGLRDESDFLFDLDCDEGDPIPRKPPLNHFDVKVGYTRNPFSRLRSLGEEEVDGKEEAEVDAEEATCFSPVCGWLPDVPKLSMSLKCASLGERVSPKGKNTTTNTKSNNSSSGGGLQSGNRSANEQLQGSASFVKVADMGEDEWLAFLEKFQELLHGAFRNRKSGPAGQRQRQRLGTSCQF